MALTYRDLFELHLKYVDYVVSKTLLIHQYLKNVSGTGSGVEVEVRELVRRVIPNRYKITHGYVVGASSNTTEPAVSPQVDLLIVDTLVPHSLWVIDDTQGMELVPAESVVAAIEIKRTLSKNKMQEAIHHLQAVRDTSGLVKNDATRYLPGGASVGGGLSGGYSGNPLFGVVGLDLVLPEGVSFGATVSELVAGSAAFGPPLELDCVVALTGALVATVDKRPPNNHVAIHVRGQSDAYRYGESSVAQGTPPRVALGRALGFILAYVLGTAGRQPDLESYFFNAAIAGESGG